MAGLHFPIGRFQMARDPCRTEQRHRFPVFLKLRLQIRQQGRMFASSRARDAYSAPEWVINSGRPIACSRLTELLQCRGAQRQGVKRSRIERRGFGKQSVRLSKLAALQMQQAEQDQGLRIARFGLQNLPIGRGRFLKPACHMRPWACRKLSSLIRHTVPIPCIFTSRRGLNMPFDSGQGGGALGLYKRLRETAPSRVDLNGQRGMPEGNRGD